MEEVPPPTTYACMTTTRPTTTPSFPPSKNENNSHQPNHLLESPTTPYTNSTREGFWICWPPSRWRRRPRASRLLTLHPKLSAPSVVPSGTRRCLVFGQPSHTSQRYWEKWMIWRQSNDLADNYAPTPREFGSFLRHVRDQHEYSSETMWAIASAINARLDYRYHTAPMKNEFVNTLLKNWTKKDVNKRRPSISLRLMTACSRRAWSSLLSWETLVCLRSPPPSTRTLSLPATLRAASILRGPSILN